MEKVFIDTISEAYEEAKRELTKVIRESYNFTDKYAEICYDRFRILITNRNNNFYYIEVMDDELEDANYDKWLEDEDSELESSCICNFDLPICNEIANKAFYMARHIAHELAETAISEFLF